MTATLGTITRTLYRGGSAEGAWWTTDRGHAASFGEVVAVVVKALPVAFLDMSRGNLEREFTRMGDTWGAEFLARQCARYDVEAVFVEGWEGTTVYAPRGLPESCIVRTAIAA